MANIIKELLIKITTNADKAKKDVDNFNKSVEKTGKKSKSASGSVEKMAESETKLSKSSETAKKNTHELKDKMEGLVSPVKDAGDALNVMKGVLGAFGVSVGIGELIKQIQTLATEAETAKGKMDDVYKSVKYQTGTLTADQEALVKKLGTRSGESIGYSGDVADIGTVVGTLSGLNPEATTAELEDLSRVMLNLNEMGFGSLDTNMRDSAALFAEFNIPLSEQADKMEYLKTVSQQTLVPFGDLLTLLKEAGPFAEQFNLGLTDVASMIGNSFSKTKSTDAVSTFLTGFEDTLESAQEEMGKDGADTYIKSYAKEWLALVNSSQFQSQLVSSTEQVISGRTNEEVSATLSNSGTVNQEGSGNFADRITDATDTLTGIEDAIAVAGETSDLTNAFIGMSKGLAPVSAALGAIGEGLLDLIGNARGIENLSDEVADFVNAVGSGDYSKYTEDVSELDTEAVTPLNDSLTGVITSIGDTLINSTLLNDYSSSTLQPTMQNEGGVVQWLTNMYLALAAAKSAAGEA